MTMINKTTITNKIWNNLYKFYRVCACLSHWSSDCFLFKRIVSNKIAFLNKAKIILCWYRMKCLSWILFISIFLSPNYSVVKQCFVELLSKVTKIRYLPTFIHMKLFFLIYRNKVGVLVVLLLTKCIHMLVCVYFLHCDSETQAPWDILTVKLARIWRNSPVSFRCSKLSRVCKIK